MNWRPISSARWWMASLLAILSFAAIAPSTLSAQAVERTAIRIDDPPVSGSLLSIDGELNISLRQGDRAIVTSSLDLVRWGERRDRLPTSLVVLNDQSELVADVLRLEANQLLLGDSAGLDRSFWEQTLLEKRDVRAIFFRLPLERSTRAQLRKQATNHSAPSDLILLSGGESIAGTVIKLPNLTAEASQTPASDVVQVQLTADARQIDIPASKVLAIVFASRGKLPVTDVVEEKKTAWISLIDGSLLNVRSIENRDGKLNFTLVSGATLSTAGSRSEQVEPTPYSLVEMIESDSPRISYLSDQKPILARHIPLLTTVWPTLFNLNAMGQPLRAQGTLFRKGIGVHSASSVVYEIDRSWKKFEAELALDDSTDGRGSVIFKVLLAGEDGKFQPAFESKIIRGGEAPTPISIPLGNKLRIALIVDFSDEGDTRDLANWLSARLVK